MPRSFAEMSDDAGAFGRALSPVMRRVWIADVLIASAIAFVVAAIGIASRWTWLGAGLGAGLGLAAAAVILWRGRGARDARAAGAPHRGGKARMPKRCHHSRGAAQTPPASGSVDAGAGAGECA